MAYIVKSDYTAFTTTAISDDDFTLISERASDIIDVITFNKIADKGISFYPSSVQNKVKKAVFYSFTYKNKGRLLRHPLF